MGKIIRLDTTRKKPTAEIRGNLASCEHKNVVVHEKFKAVRCAVCGALLDPFSVLVDYLKRHVTAEREKAEETLLEEEETRRNNRPDSDSSAIPD